MRHSLISTAVLMVCGSLGLAGQDRLELIFSDDFTSDVINSDLWIQSGQVESGENSVITESDPDGKVISSLKSKQQFTLPHIRKGDEYALRLEWSVKPVRSGSIDYPIDDADYKWGSEMRVMGGRYHNATIQVQAPFVLGLDKNKAFLNTTHSFDLPRSQDGWFRFSIDFTAESILRFSINGHEVLDEVTDSYKEGPADKVHIRLADFSRTNSKTVFGPVRLCRVEYGDSLKWHLSTWKIRGEGGANDARSFIFTTVGPMEKIFREIKTFNHPIRHSIDMACATNEYESFQIAVIPIGKQISAIRLDARDLIQQGGSERIASSAWKLHVVDYVQSSDTYTTGPKVSWTWPDPLMNASQAGMEPGYIRNFWAAIYVKPGTPAGQYKGIIEIISDNGETAEILVNLRVFGFELPKASYLYTAINFDPFKWAMWYHAEEISKIIPDEEKRSRFNHPAYMNRDMLNLVPEHKWMELYDFLLAYRISPTFIYPLLLGEETVLWPFPEHWQYCADRGMNTLPLVNVNIDWDKDAWWATPRHAELLKGDKEKYKEMLFKHLDKYYAKAKTLNWTGLTYVYGFDESDIYAKDGSAHNPAIEDLYGRIKQKYPDLPRGSANPFSDIHYGLFDIWAPPTHFVDYDQTARRQMLGEQIWPYVCCGPGKPYSNSFLDYPAIDCRVMFWEMRRANITGFLFYELNYYSGQINWNKPGPRWPEVPFNAEMFGANGSGVMVYPGPDMTPLSSVRLENTRDGIEAYDYLSMLREKVNLIQSGEIRVAAELKSRAEKALQIKPEITMSFAQHTYNPQLIEKERIEIGTILEQIVLHAKTLTE